MQAQASSIPFDGHQPLWMLALAGLMVFGVYRRFRRIVGRQPLRRVRMGLRIGLLAVIGLLLLPLGLHSAQALGAIAAGSVVGSSLGIFAAARTRFETHANEVHYIPHTTVGLAVFALFLGRVIYRFGQMYAGGAPQGTMMSPLTLGIFFVLISYNVYYGGRVLRKSRHLRPQDIEMGSMPS